MVEPFTRSTEMTSNIELPPLNECQARVRPNQSVRKRGEPSSNGHDFTDSQQRERGAVDEGDATIQVAAGQGVLDRISVEPSLFEPRARPEVQLRYLARLRSLQSMAQ